MILIGTIVTLAIFLFVGWLVATEMFQQMVWRRRVREGDAEIVRALLLEAFEGWRHARPPRGTSAHLWASVQAAELLDASADYAIVSTSAEGEFQTRDGERVQTSSSLEAAQAAAVRLLDMALYDVPNLRLPEVRVDVYTTFMQEDGTAEQRPILSVTANRAMADNLDWEALTPSETLARFDTVSGATGDGRVRAIDLPESVRGEPATVARGGSA